MSSWRVPAIAVLVAFVSGACGPSCSGSVGQSPSSPAANAGIHKIQHVVVIMQENRSFDEYFGTYPGVTGLPMKNGQFTTCVPDPATGQCVKPYHDPADVNGGGPHSQSSAITDIHGGKMDGFIAEAEQAKKYCVNSTDPNCSLNGGHDVMG